MSIDEFKNAYSLIVGTSSSVMTVIFLDYLQRKALSKRFSVIITVIVISVVTVLLNLLLGSLIENSPSVRKFFVSEDFVEGWWYEDAKNSKTKHKTLMQIQYSNGRLTLTGETFDSTGYSFANFRSDRVAFDHGNLFCEYSSVNMRNNGKGTGIDQLQFDSPPTSYKGFVYSYTQQGFFPIEGYRVDSNTLNSYNKFETIEDKKKFILHRFSAEASSAN